MHIRKLRVYRERAASAYIHTGTGASVECCYQNTSPPSFAARVYALVRDEANLFAEADSGMRVDYTKPLGSGVCTGDLPDLDILYAGSTVPLHLPLFSDIHSGSSAYYSLPDSTGSTVAGPFSYTDAVVNYTLPALPVNRYYRTLVFAENGAGLHGDSLLSDGFYLRSVESSGTGVYSEGDIRVFPNPFRDVFTVQMPAGERFTVTDLSGRLLFSGISVQGTLQIGMRPYRSEIYYLKTERYTIPVIKSD